jgi:hypothetical protein
VSRIRVIVTGLAATYPFDGVFWDYLQYALGFTRLGHAVLHLEDTGRWCYDPHLVTFVESGARNAEYLARELPRLAPELGERWFFRDATGATWGWSWGRVVEFCRSADLLVQISASCRMRDEYFAAACVAFIDSDPMYTQVHFLEYLAGDFTDPDVRKRIEMILAHDAFLLLVRMSTPPNVSFREPWWIGFQPASRSRMNVSRAAVSTYRLCRGNRPNKVQRSGGSAIRAKARNFLRFLEMPAVSSIPIEIAISGPAPHDGLRSAGWRLIDAYPVSRDPWVYRDYLANSTGEWSVAKNAYVHRHSGWFSCRSACYLSLGVPVGARHGLRPRAAPGRGES